MHRTRLTPTAATPVVPAAVVPAAVMPGALVPAAVAAVTALLLGGCGAAGTTTATATPSSAAPWIITATGSATPSPSSTLSYSPATPFPSGFLALPSAGAVPKPTGSPSCDPVQFNAGRINSASVLPGTSTAAVTWYNPGGSQLVQYRITAIAQNLHNGTQRDVGWTVVTPGACGFMTATVTGLDRKTYYTFSVDAVFSRTGDDGTRAATIARSLPVRTK